ncbi:MAG: FkbM family methyltransferase [Paraburkholderia sp.]|nr:FkbM family methyltransferase [Paraburkholderia sp.]
MGAADEPGVLHLNYDPYTSSLLKPSAQGDFEFTAAGPTDYLHRETLAPVRDVPVSVRTIDSLVAEGLAPPTFLFMDTQGTEFEIVRGGRRSIEEHTVGLVTEVEFVPYYEGQALFGDVCRELAAMGFIFAQFVGAIDCIYPFRVPYGLRSRPFMGSADALFLRVPSAFAGKGLRLAQLAFAAQAFGHSDLTFHCLSVLERLDPRLEAVPKERAYRNFLLELMAARKEMSGFLPPSFVDLYPTAEASALRFTAGKEAEAAAMEQRRRDEIRERFRERFDDLRALLDLGPSPIEAVLNEYGFLERAKELQQQRIFEVTNMLASFNIAVERT